MLQYNSLATQGNHGMTSKSKYVVIVQHDHSETVQARLSNLRDLDFFQILDGGFLVTCDESDIQVLAYNLFRANTDKSSHLSGVVCSFRDIFGFLPSEAGVWLEKQAKGQENAVQTSYGANWSPGGP